MTGGRFLKFESGRGKEGYAGRLGPREKDRKDSASHHNVPGKAKQQFLS